MSTRTKMLVTCSASVVCPRCQRQWKLKASLLASAVGEVAQMVKRGDFDMATGLCRVCQQLKPTGGTDDGEPEHA